MEQAVTLIVNGKPWMKCLHPAMIAELAVGFLYNERLIKSAKEVARVHVCDTADFVEVDTALPITKPTTWIKTTGCGGGQTAQRLEQPENPKLHEVTLHAKMISNILAEFMEAQDSQTTSRGVHCSAISDGEHIQKLADDISRHNTLDKLMGYICFSSQLSSHPSLTWAHQLGNTARARMGVSVVISLTSPNTFTVQLAEEWGMTLIGYARGLRFNVYSHPERFIDLS